MPVFFYRVFLIAITLWTVLATDVAYAACDDRPGTPTDVTARVTSLSPPTIQVRWINTATETVFWDVEMTDEQGNIVEALPAGIGHGDTGVGLPVENTYTVTPGVSRCFRVKSRTAIHTEGCVSRDWSNRACAAVASAPTDVHVSREFSPGGTTPDGIVLQPRHFVSIIWHNTAIPIPGVFITVERNDMRIIQNPNPNDTVPFIEQSFWSEVKRLDAEANPTSTTIDEENTPVDPGLRVGKTYQVCSVVPTLGDTGKICSYPPVSLP